MQATAKPTRPTWNQIKSDEPKTAETFADWAKRATPGEQQAAQEGVLGDVKNSWHEPGWRLQPYRRAVSKAGPLLHATPTQGQDLTELMQRLGLTAINASPFGNR